MRFALWNCKSLDAARLRDVVYYFSAGFSNLQAHELERVPLSTLHRCEHVICAVRGQQGLGIWPLRTHIQNGKRLAGYGNFVLIEKPC